MPPDPGRLVTSAIEKGAVMSVCWRNEEAEFWTPRKAYTAGLMFSLWIWAALWRLVCLLAR